MATPYGIEVADNCVKCKWRQDSFFCNLSEKALEAFNALTYSTLYPAGSILFVEGQDPRGVFHLCRGKVKLTTSATDGKMLIMQVAEAGDLLGLSGTISGLPYKATAETIEPSQINFIKKDDFLRFLQNYGEACFNATEQLAAECHLAHDNARSLGLSHSAAEKLAKLLITWADENGKPSAEGIRIKLLLTHQEISQIIGTSRETVTRTLASFRSQKIVSVKGSTVVIHNKPALEALVML